MGAEIWSILAIPIFICLLFLFGLNEGFSLKKVGVVFWIIGAISSIYGFFSGINILIYLSVIIIFLRASGKLGA